LLIHRLAEVRRYGLLLAAGLLMGLAFIIKQQGIFFGLFGAVYLLYADLRQKPIVWKKLIVSQVIFAAGVILPFVITCLFFVQAGVFDKFWFWTFTYANKYTSMVPLSVAWYLFKQQASKAVLGMISIWLTALLGLVLVILIKRYRREAVFAVWFLLFSFLAICPGFYFRGHYFIFLLPAAAILAGAGFSDFRDLLMGRSRALYRAAIAIAAGLIIAGVSLYQQREFLFYNTPETTSRLIYGGNPFPESLKIAEYIRANSDVNDTAAVIGSEPQIYFYSGRRAATHYIYMYPLMEVHENSARMQKELIDEIETNKPEIVVVVHVQASWLDRRDSVRDIFDWLDSDGLKDYELRGITEILSEDETVYRWDQEAAGYTPQADRWVKVYKRKQGNG